MRSHPQTPSPNPVPKPRPQTAPAVRVTRDCSRYPETDHFPNGMAVVVDYVHSKGLTFGLYTCAGTKTCVGGRPGSKVCDDLGPHHAPAPQSRF